MIVTLVTPAARADCRESLEEMHRLRYRVAVEQWGWKIPGVEKGYDKDAFDTDDTLYFLAYAEGGERLVGCGRLNPTMKPHLLSEVFADLCDLQGVPRDPAIYEFSRYIVDHQALSKEAQFAIRGRITAAINRYCLEAGVTALTWLAYQQMYARALNVWDTKPLGLPRYFPEDGATYIAAISQMTEAGLARMARAFGLDDKATCALPETREYARETRRSDVRRAS